MKDHAVRVAPVRSRVAQPVEAEVALEAEMLEPPVNLNAASEAELRSLPGIGPTLAARIVMSRALEGLFASTADLRRVQGVTPKLLAKLGSRIVAGPVVGFLVPRRRDDVVIHWTRAPQPAPKAARMHLLPATCDAVCDTVDADEPDDLADEPDDLADEPDDLDADEPEEMALADDELEEVPAPKKPRRSKPEAVAVTTRAQVAEQPYPRPVGPLVIEELPATAREPRRRLAIGLALAIAAAVTGVFYPRVATHAQTRDAQVTSADLANDVRELKADRQQVRGRLDKLEPVGEEFPKAAAQIDQLNATVQAQREESEKALVESQATVRRLRREVGILRDTIHGTQMTVKRATGIAPEAPSGNAAVASGGARNLP